MKGGSETWSDREHEQGWPTLGPLLHQRRRRWPTAVGFAYEGGCDTWCDREHVQGWPT